MGAVVSVMTGGDPFEADRRDAYEAQRRQQARQCGHELKAAAWDGVTGNPRRGAENFAQAVYGPNCNNGPWLPPSQRPTPVPPPPPRDFQLKAPGDLSWPPR